MSNLRPTLTRMIPDREPLTATVLRVAIIAFIIGLYIEKLL